MFIAAVFTKMFIVKWMDFFNVVYTHYGILHSLKKEGNPVTYHNMDEPWWYHAKWNKPVKKGQILYDFIHMK